MWRIPRTEIPESGGGLGSFREPYPALNLADAWLLLALGFAPITFEDFDMLLDDAHRDLPLRISTMESRSGDVDPELSSPAAIDHNGPGLPRKLPVLRL